MRRKKNRYGASALEYIALITILLTALLFSQKYIVRGFAGRWKQVGDSFGYGRQYDPAETAECLWSADAGQWYTKQCFEEHFNTYARKCYSKCIYHHHYDDCGGTAECGYSAAQDPFGDGGCCKSIFGLDIMCDPDCYTCCYEQCQHKCVGAVVDNECPEPAYCVEN